MVYSIKLMIPRALIVSEKHFMVAMDKRLTEDGGITER